METDDYNQDDYNPDTDRPAILPTRAKDMFGVSGDIIRNYAENGMVDDLLHDDGINMDEAWLSLHCAELASLPAWDADTLLEAATVYISHHLAMAARYGDFIVNDGVDDKKRAERRIRLALLAEKTPEIISPADGVLLLRRAGIEVFYELRDAVAVMALGGNEPERTYRQLMGIPQPPAAKVEAVKGITNGADWIDKARAIADELALERYKAGVREITARNICDAVQLELAKVVTTHGTRGERSAGNIRNEALKGWKFIPPTLE